MNDDDVCIKCGASEWHWAPHRAYRRCAPCQRRRQRDYRKKWGGPQGMVRALSARLKEAQGCKHCEETDPICLDWHHRDPTEKSDVARKKGFAQLTMRQFLEEIEKCDVLCANCHRKLHHKDSLRTAAEYHL